METRGRPKGGKNIRRSAQEKLKFVLMVLDDHISTVSISKEYGISTGSLHQWVKKYREDGIKGLENKVGGNPLSKFIRKKNLTREEELEYENLQLRIENMRLKKGYTKEGVDSTKAKLSKKSIK